LSCSPAQAASAIEMTRLYQETSRAAEQEALFNEMMQAVTSTLETNRIVQAVADGLAAVHPLYADDRWPSTTT
jgi:hypothetical protein